MKMTYNDLIFELFKALEDAQGTAELFEDETINARQDAMYKALKLKQTMLNEQMDEQKCNMGAALEETKNYLIDQLDAEETDQRGQTQGVLDNVNEIDDRIMNNVFDIKNWGK